MVDALADGSVIKDAIAIFLGRWSSRRSSEPAMAVQSWTTEAETTAFGAGAASRGMGAESERKQQEDDVFFEAEAIARGSRAHQFHHSRSLHSLLTYSTSLYGAEMLDASPPSLARSVTAHREKLGESSRNPEKVRETERKRSSATREWEEMN